MSRLIDADRLYEVIKNSWDTSDAEDFEKSVFVALATAPTIEQKYTNKELRVFMHGISIRLLSLRSAQHWTYDDETAEEIKFLERLYKKVESEVTQ